MRVLIAEDQALLREGIVALLKDKGIDVVAQAEDAEGLHRILAGPVGPAVARVAGVVTALEWRNLVVPMGVSATGSCHSTPLCRPWAIGMAEAEGFEPSMGLKPQTALAVRRHRPD